MAGSQIYSQLEALSSDAFNGELHLIYGTEDGLDALRALCGSDNHSRVRGLIVKLVITGLKALRHKGTDYFLGVWHAVARPGILPQLEEINITYEVTRSKYVVKAADFELPTEEWFTVSARDYGESFRQGDGDVEYEYPADLLQLHELKRLLVQNGQQDCEVLLTTQMSWQRFRDDHDVEEQNGDASMQSVTFRVLSDDLESIARLYK